MDKELIKDFTKRVSQANKTDLVVIQYDIILQSIEDAKRLYSLEKTNSYYKAIDLAINFVNELISTLDFNYQISIDLFNLYRNVNEYLIIAKIKKDATYLSIPCLIMESLRKAFVHISREDNQEAIMKNTQQVYAGLTYGKANLNEHFLEKYNRGFKA